MIRPSSVLEEVEEGERFDYCESSDDQVPYEFTVIGAGPGGISAVANLIDRSVTRLAWVDPEFEAGMIGSKYREVPSNTTVQTFLDCVSFSPTLLELVRVAKRPNAYTVLEGFPRDEGVNLGLGAELLRFLTRELISQRSTIVKSIRGKVMLLNFDSKGWNVEVEANRSERALINFNSSKVVLSIGSRPIRLPPKAALPEIDLDIALSRSKLQKFLQEKSIKDRDDTKIAVVGSSHSAILVLSNLLDLTERLTLIHLYRSPLRFAVKMEGWTLYDNTGLKGFAADWAREVYPISRRIQKVQITDHEDNQRRIGVESYEDKDLLLEGCSMVVHGIGFEAIEGPKIMAGKDHKTRVTFDHRDGCFNLDGLYGCGIAFPELVVDRAGNSERAVGFFKFMKSLKHFTKLWTKN
ncbi:pyridine nucleotide-disulphide oxidoreductase-domain-containing protein [Phakopsora pachyrhizi]|uniref:Pyridine nucleotide-disulphide oxidoreductase-domain-containing protein n=1 Tax=Phakopsora pachyrhizi TaxID=170000 RepID=A0AAV0AVN1_PHAPC|nr:pyridine nucleotide-disulphide oxidoreductase-domain-containing protein [Phakopsora pachyrhizi]